MEGRRLWTVFKALKYKNRAREKRNEETPPQDLALIKQHPRPKFRYLFGGISLARFSFQIVTFMKWQRKVGGTGTRVIKRGRGLYLQVK